MRKICYATLALTLVGCTGQQVKLPPEDKALQQASQESSGVELQDTSINNLIYSQEMQESMPQDGDKILVLDTDKGVIKIKLFWDDTPELVKNFTTIAESGKYDGVSFHRVMEDFVIQAGDYENGDGTGGQSYTGRGLADEITPKLRHIRGAVGAAKSRMPNSIGSQFYIMHEANKSLDDGYSVFGQVIEGMDVVDSIATVETDANDKPLKAILIKQATVEEFKS